MLSTYLCTQTQYNAVKTIEIKRIPVGGINLVRI